MFDQAADTAQSSGQLQEKAPKARKLVGPQSSQSESEHLDHLG